MGRKKKSPPAESASKYWFDAKEADRIVALFATNFKHVKGPLAGQPLVLDEWQEREIIRPLFGWKRKSDNTRRYRRCYIEIPRKSGKSTLSAGLGIIGLVADREQGAEVYSAAADRDQAAIVFDVAKSMVEADPELSQMIRPFRRSMTYEQKSSSYKVLSADAPTKHGLNASMILFDELHAQPNRELWDVLTTSTGARSQPLVIAITTAGYDRHSICWEQHDYAVKVLAGVIEDDSFLAVIYAAEGPHVQSFQSLQAVQQLDILCSCKCVPSTLIDQSLREACARLAITPSIVKQRQGSASTTPNGLPDADNSAARATTHYSNGKIPSTAPSATEKAGTGQGDIQSRSQSASENGSRTTGQRSLKTADGRDTASHRTSGASSFGSMVDDAGFALPLAKRYASITAMLEARFGDSFASNATVQSAISVTLRTLFAAHSPTCNVRQKCQLSGDSLSYNYPGDDWTDPKVWAKANPGLGKSITLEYLENEAKRAAEVPAYQNTFRRLHLNQWTEQETRWIDMAVWERNELPVNPEELEGRECFGGLDLASTTDIAALCLVFPPKDSDQRWQAMWRFWVPEEGISTRSKKDRVPYDLWERDGFITATEGNITDYDLIRRDITELKTRYNIREIAYDRWNATQLTTQLEGDGFTMVPFGQGFASMAAPTKELLGLLTGDRIAHGTNPVAKWMASNVTVRTDPAGNQKPDKGKSSEKIDGIVAEIMALGRAMVQPEAVEPSIHFLKFGT